MSVRVAGRPIAPFQAVLGVALLLLSGLAAYGLWRVLPALARGGDQIDLAAYYLAARATTLGLSPYDMNVFASLARAADVPVPSRYIYPPFLAAVMQPLGDLPFATARYVWMVVNLGVLVAIVLLLRQLADWSVSRAVTLGLPIVSVFPASYDTLLYGQINLIVLLPLVGATVAIRRGSSRGQVVAGACLGLAAMVKVFPAVLLLAFLFRRQWRPLATAAFVVLATLLVGLIAAGIDDTVRYIVAVFPALRETILHPPNQSLDAAIGRLVTPTTLRFAVFDTGNLVRVHVAPIVDAPTVAPVLSLIARAGVVLVASASVIRRARTAADPTIDLALLLVTAILVSPMAWEFYAVYLLLPYALLLRRAGSSRAAAVLVVASLACIILQRYWRPIALYAPSPLLQAFGCLAFVLVWLLLVQESWRVDPA